MKIAAKALTFFCCLSIVFLSHQSVASSPIKQEASQGTWTYYANDEEGTAYAVNFAAVEHLKGDLVRAWVKATYSEQNPKFKEGQFQWEIQCAKKMIRGIAASAKMKDGTSTMITESSDWSSIPAGSTAETLFELVCKKKGK